MIGRRFLFLLLAPLLPALPAAAQQRRPLLIEGKQTLFQRVILRPGATLSARPDAAAPSRPVPGFSVFYVYGRQGGPQGWVELGAAADGHSDGWVKADRTIDWKQTLVVAFSNPAGRDRAMFFRDEETPRRLWLAGADRAAQARTLREAAMANREGAVIALEPETFVDITQRFYLMPILSWQAVENERAEASHVLEVASAPAMERIGPPPESDDEALRNYKGALVFVVDTTTSMGPYIDRTRDALRRIIARIGQSQVRDNFRFGMVAFRDHMGGDPRLEYVTRMIAAPNFAEAPDAILGPIASAQEAAVSNEGFDEDAMAGIKLALDEVPWQEFSGRFIVLVTDAGTRNATDPRSQTHLGPAEMSMLARSENKRVAIFALHLRTPEGRSNHARAEAQYRTLTTFEGAGALYYPVPNGDPALFSAIVDSLTEALLTQVSNAIGRPIGGPPPPRQNETEQRLSQQVEIVGNAMRLAYLGQVRRQAAPDVVRSFVLDDDPADPQPERRPLLPRVLLTRNQLSDLAATLRAILDAGRAGRLAPDSFFTRVRAATAAMARDPRRMAELQRLSGTFGEYLDDLPYRSQIAEITQEDWQAMGSGQRTEILNALEAKLRLYEEFNRQTALWVSFDNGRNPGEALYPVPLDALP